MASNFLVTKPNSITYQPFSDRNGAPFGTFRTISGYTLNNQIIQTQLMSKFHSNDIMSDQDSRYLYQGNKIFTNYSPVLIATSGIVGTATKTIPANASGIYVILWGAGGGGGGGGYDAGGTEQDGDGGGGGGSGQCIGVYLPLPATQVVESPHPYSDNYTQDFILTSVNATGMKITFDPQTFTEFNFDYLRFYTSEADRTAGINAVYSNSGSSWPEVTLPHGTLYGRFTADYSYTFYGFKLTATFSPPRTDTTLSYTIGTGGSGGKAGGTDAGMTGVENGGAGSDGADSSFTYNSVTYTAKGGKGGGGGIGGNNGGTSSGGAGGSGSTNVPTKTNINIVTNGNAGSGTSVDTGGAGGTATSFGLTASGFSNLGMACAGGGQGGSGDTVGNGSGSVGNAGNSGVIHVFVYYDDVER